MKVQYNKDLDILYFSLSDEKAEESSEDKAGIIIDYASNGNVVGIEILNASKRAGFPNRIEYEVA